MTGITSHTITCFNLIIVQEGRPPLLQSDALLIFGRLIERTEDLPRATLSALLLQAMYLSLDVCILVASVPVSTYGGRMVAAERSTRPMQLHKRSMVICSCLAEADILIKYWRNLSGVSRPIALAALPYQLPCLFAALANVISTQFSASVHQQALYYLVNPHLQCPFEPLPSLEKRPKLAFHAL